MNTTGEIIAWIDCETTGLHAHLGDRLLEVACFITNYNLDLLDDRGFHAIVKYSPSEVLEMQRTTDPYVIDMHHKSGLWDKLSDGTPLGEVDRGLHAYISNFAETPRTARIGGNSIRLDLNFIDEYLPAVSNHLHYRTIDVSVLAKLAKAWNGYEAPPHVSKHEARSDILDSINQLKNLRHVIQPNFSPMSEILTSVAREQTI